MYVSMYIYVQIYTCFDLLSPKPLWDNRISNIYIYIYKGYSLSLIHIYVITRCFIFCCPKMATFLGNKRYLQFVHPFEEAVRSGPRTPRAGLRQKQDLHQIGAGSRM